MLHLSNGFNWAAADVFRARENQAMSDLQKAWAKNKLGVLPDALEEAQEAEEAANSLGELHEAPDDDSSSASSASSVSSTGTIVPTANQRLFARPQG